MAKYIDVGDYRYATQDASGHRISPLGKGSYGTVWLGEHKVTKELVAVKQSVNLDPAYNKFIDNELSIHRNIQHPNLVRCYHVDDKYVHGGRQILMVLEYMPGGDMDGYLTKKYPNGMPEAEARRFLTQIAAAFQYLSSQGLVHRDLKPANMLLTDHSKDTLPDLKIADFGFARTHNANDLMMTRVGSPLYMAPEVLNSQPYTSSVDVWSAGIIFIQLLTGKRPFPHARVEKDIVDFIADASKFEGLINSLKISAEGRAVVRRMLAPLAKNRLTWEAFMDLDYIRPSIPEPGSSLDQSTRINGVAHWMLLATSIETGGQIGITVTPELPVAKLRRDVCYALNPSALPSDLMMVTARHGAMNDGAKVGDYFKQPAQHNAAARPGLDNVVHVCFAATYRGDFPIYGEPVPDLPALSAYHAGSTVDFRAILKSGLFAAQSNSDESPKWHSIMSGWRSALEALIAHADELSLFATSMAVLAKKVSAATNRKSSYLALHTYTRMWCAMLVKRFEPISLVLKEMGPIMNSIRPGIPAMFDEARGITFEPVIRAFPTLQLDPSSSIVLLLREPEMLQDLGHCEVIQRSLLEGELMFSKSSDPSAANSYNLPGASYAGSTFSPTVAVAPSGNDVPVMIKRMADINSTMTDLKWHISTKLEQQCGDFSKALHAFNASHDHFGKVAANAMEALNLALSKPSSFVLTSEMTNPVHSNLSALADAYDELTRMLKETHARMTTVLSTRKELDCNFAEIFKRNSILMTPFYEFESKFQTDWKPEVLDFFSHKPRSLMRLLGFPKTFKNILVEIERRRKWSQSIKGYAAETQAAYEAIMRAEEEMREDFFATNSLLSRFKDVFPAGYELLNRHVAGSLRATLHIGGVAEYPEIQSPIVSAAQVASSSQIAPPVPQNPTEEDYARLSAQSLIEVVFAQRRELDALYRQRVSLFQTGVDQALLKAHEQLLEENQRLLAEVKDLKAKQR
jgi:serine/threonine protein kinase